MNINSALDFAKKNKKTLVFILAILVILIIILYLHYAYDLFGLKEHEFDEKVRENYEVDTKTLDNDSIQSLNNQYNNIQVSVHKPDNALRACAHNQKCYNELMDVREHVLEYLKTIRR